jgi:hypothetical protein
MMTRTGGAEPLAAGRRSSRGHWLKGHGAAVCSSGSRGSDGGVSDGWRWDVHVGTLEEVDSE